MRKTPIEIAEQIAERVESVPWPLVAFLEKTRQENIRVHTYKTTDPEPDRLRHKNSPNVRELGTYKAGITTRDITQDVLEAMRVFR